MFFILLGVVLVSAAIWFALDLLNFYMSDHNVWVRRLVVVAVIPWCIVLTLLAILWEAIINRSPGMAWPILKELGEAVREAWGSTTRWTI